MTFEKIHNYTINSGSKTMKINFNYGGERINVNLCDEKNGFLASLVKHHGLTGLSFDSQNQMIRIDSRVKGEQASQSGFNVCGDENCKEPYSVFSIDKFSKERSKAIATPMLVFSICRIFIWQPNLIESLFSEPLY